jgi:chemotaxis protein CheY-P-specific phosphatase CheC
MSEDKNAQIEVGPGEQVTPHNEALYEAGKEMMTSSLTTSREFCQTMITVSSGAIAIYSALLTFGVPKDTSFSTYSLLIALIPSFLFLVCTIVFVVGCMPTVSEVSLDIIDEIKRAYENTLRNRRKIIIVGTILFVVALVLAIIIVTSFALGFYFVKPVQTLSSTPIPTP